MIEASQVARITVPETNFGAGSDVGPIADALWDLARTLWRLAFDDRIRVVVLTDIATTTVPSGSGIRSAEPLDASRAGVQWRLCRAVVRAHYAFALMDKPVVAEFTRNISGNAGALLLAADLVVAADHVTVRDQPVNPDGSPGWRLGAISGDGATSLMPLFMTPGRAKEFLLTSRTYSARELEQLGVINYAVPAGQTAAKVEELVAALLRRPAYALAATKRIANKPLLHQLNLSLDSGAAYSALAAFDHAM